MFGLSGEGEIMRLTKDEKILLKLKEEYQKRLKIVNKERKIRQFYSVIKMYNNKIGEYQDEIKYLKLKIDEFMVGMENAVKEINEIEKCSQ